MGAVVQAVGCKPAPRDSGAWSAARPRVWLRPAGLLDVTASPSHPRLGFGEAVAGYTPLNRNPLLAPVRHLSLLLF